MKNIFLFVVLVATAATSFASDGVLEINQTCALSGGCFSGDTAGFPVTIDGSAGVSYKLTGSLDLGSVPDTTAIEIDAPYITLDLNGFEIRGPITCTGSGAGLNCGAVGNGDGIALSANADYVTIRNGTIRNMSRHGVGASGNELRVIDVTARHNARDGLNGGSNSIAVNCIANQNGNDGFQFGSGSVIEQSAAFGNFSDGIRIESSNGVINNSTARNNGGQGFEMGHSSRFGKNASTGNFALDTCGGGICSEKQRFYLTPNEEFDGSEPLTACANGFHLASFPELNSTSSLAYDTILGFVLNDSGAGAPSAGGWIRTSFVSSVQPSCEGWTTNSPGAFGLRGAPTLPNPSGTSGAINTSPWDFDRENCDVPGRVWCVED